MAEQPGLDFIQSIVDEANGVQLQNIIVTCKQFLEKLRDHNEFLESQPLIQVLTTLRSCAIAEALRRDINFVI